MKNTYQFTPFEEVLAAFKAGQMIVMVDDDDRENEGDLVVATESLKEEQLAFMMQNARGLICVSISEEIATRLELPLQVAYNNAPLRTAFTVSINHQSQIQDGVTAAARTHTMRRLVASDAAATEFVTPGYVFPLIANSRGVVGRRGQTEGSYDLARLAGLAASGVICEILNQDGTMMRGEALVEFSKEHKLPLTSVEEILKYRIKHEPLIRQVACADRKTAYGTFKTVVFEDDIHQKEHLALIYGDKNLLNNKNLLIRIHSECLTGDVFGSRRCDCGAQLDQAIAMIVKEGSGIILYMRQEGRGIGLLNKVRAYALQDDGLDTVEANLHLGFEADKRDFTSAAAMLKLLEINQGRLLTNNPLKISMLNAAGIKVTERVPLVVADDQYSRAYLETKRDKLGHLF